MIIRQYKLKKDEIISGDTFETASMVLVFGDRESIGKKDIFQQLNKTFPKAQ
ncbi:MAG: hypothetical protein JWO06_2582, partial [Bacteroidota bacterium]|nr:hypothetical protein [Bacteroidota bacterium]